MEFRDTVTRTQKLSVKRWYEWLAKLGANENGSEFWLTSDDAQLYRESEDGEQLIASYDFDSEMVILYVNHPSIILF